MNNTVANDTALSVTPETLPAIMWQNQPVITTELLADIYGTSTDNISQNFTRNASRFIEGVHYYLLQGADLKAFKANLLKEGQPDLQPSFRGVQISNMVRKLYLWTERGTVRHAKILDTDNAWLVQDRLEDFYFTKNQIKPYGLKDLAPATKTQYGILSAIIADIATSSGKEGATKVALWSRFSNHFNLGSAKDLPAIKFDEAKAYLENLKADYDRGFTLAVVKKDDLLALGYDSETKMFAVKALEQPVKALPAPQPVMEIPNNMAMISITKLAELEKFSVTNERYFRQLPPKRTNVKEMLECLDVGMNLITDALDDLVFENKNIDRAVDKILKGLLAMRRYQPKHMQADYYG